MQNTRLTLHVKTSVYLRAKRNTAKLPHRLGKKLTYCSSVIAFLSKMVQRVTHACHERFCESQVMARQ
jgi:hypothetical protein